MISVSEKWTTAGIYYAHGTLDVGGETLVINPEDIMENGIQLNDAVSDMNVLTVGSVITNSITLTLNNFEGKFDAVDFKSNPEFTLKFTAYYEDGTSETIQRGIYALEKPSTRGSTITVNGFDRMDKMNKTFVAPLNMTYMDYYDFVQYCCTQCGLYIVEFNLPTFSEVPTYPSSFPEGTTYRQVLSWILQLCGAYGRISRSGYLVCKPVGEVGWSNPDDYDGMKFQPWETGWSYYGGVFDPWFREETIDGGTIAGDAYLPVGIMSAEIGYEDIELTGVRVVAYNGESFLSGTEGYVLTIDGNPFVKNASYALFYAGVLAQQMRSLNFRPFNASLISNPAIEAGDAIIIEDYRGNRYASMITNLSYGSGMTISCELESEVDNSNDYANPSFASVDAGSVSAGSVESETLILEGDEVEDFVIDEAFDETGWSYRIWKSGLKEMWYNKFSITVPMTAEGNGYHGVISTNEQFPVAFAKTKKHLQVSVEGGWASPRNSGTATALPVIDVYNFTSGDLATALHIYVSGK